MATPKRNYSFGLISRLAIIGAFVGLGSWAVFNSKFRKDPEEIAQQEQNADSESEDPSKDENPKTKTEGNEESKTLLTSTNNKAQPASFVDDSKPSKNKSKKRKQNPVSPGKSESKSGFKAPSSKTSFSASKKDSKSATTPPPSFSFSDNKSKKSGGFSPPSSGGFTPSKSSFGSDSKKQPGKTVTTAIDKDKKKAGPPSSSFNPGSSFGSKSGKNDLTKSAKSEFPKSSSFSSGNKKSSSPSGLKSGSSIPSRSFSAGKSAPKKSASNLSAKKSGSARKNSTSPPASGFNPSGTAKSSGTSGFMAGNSGKSAAPPTSFDPRGSFQSPAETTGSSFGGNKSGGFQSRSSSGNERPLRSVNRSGSKQESSKSAFSLSSDKTTSIPPSGTSSPPRNNFNPQGTASQPRPNAFSGGAAFQDKGSKPLPKNSIPKSNGLVKSQGSSGVGSSSTGFADIGKSNIGKSGPSKKSSNPGTNLDPRKLNAGPTNRNNTPGNSRPPSNASIGGNDRRLGKSGDSLGANQKLGPNSSPGGLSGNPAKFASNPNFQGSVQSGVNDRKPGPSSLEGLQAPAVTLQKFSPREIQVNVESEFQLVVRNVGRASATNIMIVDPIPDGTQFVSADPVPTERGTDGSLIWKIGALSPNQQQVIKVTLLPKRQGEVGSVARMSFQSAATAKAICTKPELSITHSGPQKVLKGKAARYSVIVQNNGDGVAKNVVIEDEVPVGFAFGDGKGSRLGYELGDLPPGSRREVLLNLRAVETGRYTNEIRLKMGKTMAANHKLDLEVVAPKLKMEIVGPTRRYIQREAKYAIEVQNTGTASAQNVLMVTRLPKGLRFVRTNNRGQYSPREHAVYWSMVELSPQNKGTVELTVMPVGTGQQEIEFECRSLLDRTALRKFPVIVDQLAELFFEVDDGADPIEVNGMTEYRIRVVNQGSKAATNVQVKVEMPAGIQATDTKGPTKGTLSGQKVAFAPVATLTPRGELFYFVKAKGIREGNHLIKVSLSSNERREAVAKQEDTKVYSEFR